MISSRRLCRDADGRIVEADDPAAAFLVVCAGGEVPPEARNEVAAFLGAEPEPEPEPTERTVMFGNVQPFLVADPAAPVEPEPEPDDEPKAIKPKRVPKPKG